MNEKKNRPIERAGQTVRFMGSRLLLSLGTLVASFFILNAFCAAYFPALLDSPLSRSDRSKEIFFPPLRDYPEARGTNDAFRIVFIGDSFTAGEGVQPYDRFATRIEAMMNLSRPRIPAESYIMAIHRTSTFQQIAMLEKVLNVPPDLVVLTLCLNDTEDWTRPKQLMEWRQGQLIPPPESRAEKLLAKTFLGKALYIKWKQRVSARAYLDYYRHLYDKNYTGWQRFADSIEIFGRRCREADTPLIVVIFPLLADSMEAGRYPFEAHHEQILAELHRNNVPVLDLLNIFRITDPLRMQALPGIDPHPSEIAHRIAAEALFYRLLDAGLIDRKYFPKDARTVIQERWKQIAESMDPFSPGNP